MEKEYLLKHIEEYNSEYKNNIGMDIKETFGIEIETERLKKDKFNKEYGNEFIFWKRSKDISLRPSGLEFISPIFRDRKIYWEQIKVLCDLLEKNGAVVDVNCSFHIHYGIQSFEDNPDYLMNFIKLWMVYENIIYKYAYGKRAYPRLGLDQYANMCSIYLNRILNGGGIYFYDGYNLDYDENKILEKDIFNYSKIFGDFKKYGLSFRYDYDDNVKTMEVRCCNGTLDPILMQNYILFFYKLIEYSKNCDIDLLNYNFDKLDVSKNTVKNSLKIDIDKALELANCIYTTDEEKLDFMKVYIKERKKSIFY